MNKLVKNLNLYNNIKIKECIKEKEILPIFSHIYVEEKALNNENTKKILAKFNNAKVIKINHYKDMFCRSNQNFYIQKTSPKIILACKEEKLVYEGAKMCESFGNDYFYYTSSMMNCLYNCEYCYLQGMYPSSNIVIFVNIEDIFKEVEDLLKIHPVYLCVSYDTDLLALENIVGFTEKWLKFASKHSNLKIEIRTKSCNFSSIYNIEPLKNVILAWTLSPEYIIENYEKGTPSLKNRLNSIKDAIERGWIIRLCFDPILYVKDFKDHYKQCIETTFNTISAHKILDVSLGVFRVSKDYFKKMKKLQPNSKLLSYAFHIENGVCTYDEEHSKELIDYVYELVKQHMAKDKIFI